MPRLSAVGISGIHAGEDVKKCPPSSPDSSTATVTRGRSMELAANFSLSVKGVTLDDEYQKLVNLLKEWAEWMHGYNPNIGFRSRVPMLATGGISTTFDEMLEQIDTHAMKAIDASIDSLPPSNRAAINRCYGVCAVFRFPRANYPYDIALSDAHDLLMVTLKRKGVIV